MKRAARDSDWLVAGGGATAQATALLAATRFSVTLLSPPPTAADRHYALTEKSYRLLSALNVAEQTQTVRRFALFYDGVLGRRKVDLHCADGGMDALCRIISEHDLLANLQKQLRQSAVVQKQLSLDDIVACESDDENCRLTTTSGEKFSAKLLVAADGAHSKIAAVLRIAATKKVFNQHALTMKIKTSSLANDSAAQFFARQNVLAMLPLGDGVFSLIWSLPSSPAMSLYRAGGAAIARQASQQTGFVIVADGAPACFPLLATRRAVRVSKRVAFIGDSARAIHPLAGQGFNLAMGDADCLVNCVVNYADADSCVGADSCADVDSCAGADYRRALQKYAARRECHSALFHKLTAMFAEKSLLANVALTTLHFPPMRKLAVQFANR